MKVIIRYNGSMSRIFYNLSNDDVMKLRNWMNEHGKYPSTVILEFFYENKIYYLNRDLVADMEVVINAEV